MEKLESAISKDDAEDLERLLNSAGDGSAKRVLQEAAERCISKGSYECLELILKSRSLASANIKAVLNLTKEKNDLKAFALVTSYLTLSDMLGLLNFANEQYGLAMQVVKTLSQHNAFIQGFKDARKSDLARKLEASPVTLRTNIVNPYKGAYFPGREEMIEDVCGKVCFPGGLQRNIICFCGKDHSGKTTVVKKIATLSCYCKNTEFDGILVVETSSLQFSNVEDPIKKSLEALTGDASLDQLFNGTWLLAFILNTTGDKEGDVKQSELVVNCVDSLVEKSEKKLRVILRIPDVGDAVNAEFLQKTENLRSINEIPELTKEEFDFASDNIFGKKRDHALTDVLDTKIPHTHYFLFELKRRGGLNVAGKNFQSKKADFFNEISQWRGTIQTFKPHVLTRAGTSYSDFVENTAPTTPGGVSVTESPPYFGRSSTMPNLYNTSSHGYSSNYSDITYSRMNYDDYMIRTVVTLPNIMQSNYYNDDFHKSVDVTFVLLIEQYFNLGNANEQQVQFLNSNDPTVFRYTVTIPYHRAMDALKRNPREIRMYFIREIRERAKTHQLLYKKLEKCLDGLQVDLHDANQGRGGYNNYYNSYHSDRPSLSGHHSNSSYRDYDYDAYSPFSPPPMSPSISHDSLVGTRKKKKTANRSNSKNYRARQDLVQSKRLAVQNLLGERLIPDEKMIYLRGPKVLFIPSKSPNSLMKIADFVKDIDEDPNVTIKRAALPLSRKN